MFVLTLYVRYFSRYLGTYRHTYIQKVSFYNIDDKKYPTEYNKGSEKYSEYILILSITTLSIIFITDVRGVCKEADSLVIINGNINFLYLQTEHVSIQVSCYGAH